MAYEVPHSSNDIDEGLYSRQLYVLGHEAMCRIATTDILISGLRGLGVEVAKNLILGGVKSVTLHDQEVCETVDLSSQFYLSEDDIGRNRAESTLPHLAELNTYVPVKSYAGPLTKDIIKKFKVIVLTNNTLEEQLKISEWTHSNNIALIIADVRGLFSQLFCDFGECFTVLDGNGESPAYALISDITSNVEGVVTCLEDTRHGLENGDYVTFSEVQGMIELNHCSPIQVKVLGPYTFSIGDTTKFSEYTRGGIVNQVKIPKVMNFKPLKESLREPEFFITDFSKLERPSLLHLAFCTLHKFVEQYRRVPRSWNEEDAKTFVSLSISFVDKDSSGNCLRKDFLQEAGIGLSPKSSDCSKKEFSINIDQDVLKLFSKIAVGHLSPMNAFVGGVVAQEVMKACTGKFTPIYQWMYFDAAECLTSNFDLPEHEYQLRGSRYDGQISVFGNTFQEKLSEQKYFVVGAGAIGCELLKNFAFMGLGASTSGKIVITDMDFIEKSNLNRQFLFKPCDVQFSKSFTAARAICKMNPMVNIEAFDNKVGPETENVFDDSFFESLDGVANALDNVDARAYMDQKCVHFRKPLLDSGTLGTKGSVQVVIPFLTESYSSSHDPRERDIPICTLKSFPNKIEHTIIWARDEFESLFHDAPKNAIQYLQDLDFVNRIMQLQGAQPLEIFKSVKKTLVDNRPHSFEDCVIWARQHWQDQYNHQIKHLLLKCPEDHVTMDGKPFWSGHRRCPKLLEFSANDSLHLDYLEAAANLMADVYGIPQCKNRNMIAEIANKVKVSEYIYDPEAMEVESNSSDQISNSNIHTDSLKIILKELPEREAFNNLNLTPLKFEKDDDSNFHIDFIVAASNLRAANYNIPQADHHQSKQIAGKIIPAIATTTSVVAGLVCLEIYKLVQGFKTLDKFKNRFVNLALPFFGFSEPLPAFKSMYYDIVWTLWDRFEIQGELTLREFIEHFKDKYNLEITMLSKGARLLYSFFMSKEIYAGVMDLQLTEIMRKLTGEQVQANAKSLVFEMCCNDSDGNDVDVPCVHYVLPN